MEARVGIIFIGGIFDLASTKIPRPPHFTHAFRIIFHVSMYMLPLLHRLLLILLPLSILATTYLYLYPFVYGCAFPTCHHPPSSSQTQHNSIPPFRLLALGDPQLEGDSSLPSSEDGYFPSITSFAAHLSDATTIADRWNVLQDSIRDLVLKEIPRALQSCRKQLDLFGNDYYLAHIYRTLRWWVQPTHVTVLGDLLGSQWIDDEEFERRGWRYWSRVFHGGRRVPDPITRSKSFEVLGENRSWETRIINIAGNHDVGYAGDMDASRVERFDHVFGSANWDIIFEMPSQPDEELPLGSPRAIPSLRLLVLNSLNLDTPALDPDLQARTYEFINEAISTSQPVEETSHFTILLTHLPLHKPAGVCVDAPFFDFYDEEHGAGVKEQNHISYDAGQGILEGIFGMSGNPAATGGGFGRRGIVLTGHDHEGCDVWHYLPKHEDVDMRKWNATRWQDRVEVPGAHDVPGIREITVRSMMGEFGGNAGLLSVWFEREVGEWRVAFARCALGVQHWWWAIHILDALTLAVGALVLTLDILRAGSGKGSTGAWVQKLEREKAVMARLKGRNAGAESSGISGSEDFREKYTSPKANGQGLKRRFRA